MIHPDLLTTVVNEVIEERLRRAEGMRAARRRRAEERERRRQVRGARFGRAL